MIFTIPSFGDVGNFSHYINSGNSTDNSTDDSFIKVFNPAPPIDQKANQEKEKSEPKPTLQGIPSPWKVCAVNSDCTAAAVDCVNWEGTNKKYLKEIATYVRVCSTSIDPGFQPEAICENKECRTTEKMTTVSWEEWLGQEANR